MRGSIAPKLTVALAILALYTVPSILLAQGSAFTYQGQLQNNGLPATGTYNLQFELYNNSAGSGTAVAGPVTINGVTVSNGFFTVTVDFGAGPWNGQSNWLQIAVETNKAVTFATLTPLQALTPMPYAVFAETTSNFSGTLSASQLSGEIANANLPANPVFSGTVTANGFSGNGSGLNNLQASNISGTLTNNTTGSAATAVTAANAVNLVPSSLETNMNNTVWVRWRAGLLNNFYNIGMGSWTNTLAKLGAKKTIKVELDGSGFMGWLGYDFGTNLYGHFPCAGCGTFYVNQFWPLNYPSATTNCLSWNGSNGRGNPMDGWWYGNGYDMTNAATGSNSTIRFTANFPFNRVEIDAVCAPWGGTLTLYTNGPGSAFAWRSTGITLSTATTGGAVYGTNWTIDLPCQFVESVYGACQLMLYQTGRGTNRIVDEWAFNTNVLFGATNGVVVNVESGSGTSVTNQLSVSNSIASVIYSNWFPTLILYQDIEDTNAILSGVSRLVGFYQSNCPGADICLSGTCPTSIDGNGSTYDPIQQNIAYMNVAMAKHVAYFDPHTPFENTNTMVLRGWWYDGTHPEGFYQGWDGFKAWAYWWYYWMQFQMTN